VKYAKNQELLVVKVAIKYSIAVKNTWKFTESSTIINLAQAKNSKLKKQLRTSKFR
jgi:hypothetical protein